MKLIHKRDLNYKTSISQSILSPIIGTLVIGTWGYFTFTFMLEKLPKFIFFVNVAFLLLFVLILLKQYLQFLNHKSRFYMAFDLNGVFLPLNHAIKSPKDENNYFLYFKFDEINKFEIIRESKSFNSIRQGKEVVNIQNMDYISFSLREDISEEVKNKHSQIVNSTGFTGSPVTVEDNKTIEYSTEGNFFGMKKVEEVFRKRGLYSGRMTKRKIDLKNKYTFEEMKKNLIRLSMLGKSIDVNNILDHIEKSGKLTQEQIKDLRSDPKIKALRLKSKRT